MTIDEFITKLTEKTKRLEQAWGVIDNGLLRTPHTDYPWCPIEFIVGKPGAFRGGDDLGLSRADVDSIIVAADCLWPICDETYFMGRGAIKELQQRLYAACGVNIPDQGDHI